MHQAATTLATDGVRNVGGMLWKGRNLVTIGDKFTAAVLYFCGPPPVLPAARSAVT
jgi:hypothetical protein